MNYYILVFDVKLDHISFSITPSLPNLTKTALLCFLNDTFFTDYDLIPKDLTGASYDIVPKTNFTPYDSLIIYIIDSFNQSNIITISLAKYFYLHTSVLEYLVSDIHSGKYTLKIKSVNDEDFPVSAISPAVFCNGINDTLSDCYPEKYKYSPTEPVFLYIKLFDKSGLKVPDGKYLIKLVIEKI